MPRRLGGWGRNVSMASWLAVAVLLVTVTSLIVTSIVSLTYGQDLAEGLIDGQLQSRASVKADEVARYLEGMQARTAALATGTWAAEASVLFSDAYAELGTLDRAVIDEAVDPVAAFYRDEFAPALGDAIGTTVPWRTLVPVGDEALYLQHHYVVGSEDDVIVRGLTDDAGDGSTWSEVHRQLHLGLLEITERLGAADLYLVEPDNGNIVYSAAKGSDFATSLDVGPHGGSTLAAAMRTVREAPERGAVTMLDMAPHVPDLGAPMLFMASPVFDGSELVAILILKIPVDPIDEIMTSETGWAEEGFDDTGEAYLVASDGRMRSVSRPFVEAPEIFLTDLAVAGTATEAERDAIAGVGTTVVFLKVADGREVAEAAVLGDGLVEGTNYLLRPVLRAVESLELDGLEWFVIAETERVEINDPITDFRQALLIAVAIFVIAITFATVAWAQAVFRPVRAISEKLRRIHEGEEPEEADPMKRAPRDFTDLAHSIDEMLVALHRREIELEAASSDRLDTVRTLLPPAIAERVEAGDRNVIDQVQQAGIVVLVIDGLGDIVRRRDVAEAKELLDHLVEEIDTLAHHHGLERVKLVGDAYFAGCGLVQPYLDHVPRSAAFALDARDAIREMSAEYDLRPEIAAGIHSGPVTVGLTGSARLVYDLWGETVSTAHFLARMARPSEILATDAVRELLPPDIAVAPRSNGPDEVPVWEITGHLAAKETPS